MMNSRAGARYFLLFEIGERGGPLVKDILGREIWKQVVKFTRVSFNSR